MAIALVNNTSFAGGNGAAFYDVTLGWTPAVGEQIEVSVNASTASNTFGAVTLTGVSAWATDVTTDTNRRLRVFRGIVTSAVSGNLRINASGGNFTGNIAGNVSGWTGLPRTSGIITGQTSATSGTLVIPGVISSPSSTPPANRDAIVFAQIFSPGVLSLPLGGWTLLANPNTSYNIAYKLVSASGSPSAEAFTAVSASSGVWAATITCYALGTINISVQPSNIASVPGSFSPTMKAQAWSDGSAIDTGFTSAITVAVNSGGGTLSGTLNPSAVAGEATYTGVGMSAGTGAQTLVFTAPGCMAQVSSSFSLGTPATLAFVQQPTAIIPGNTFSPTVTVEVLTDGVNRDTGSTLSVTIAISSGAGTLSGTVTRNAVAGLVTFTGLGQATGSGTHALTASGSGYSDAVSNNYAVAVVTCVITTQPPECIANSAVHGLVAAKYADGVLDTTATGNATLNLQSGSGSTAGSTLVVAFTPGTGLATFTNLIVTVTAGNGGPKVWRATLPTGQTADATSVIVRETLFATTGNYTTHQTIRDPQANFLHIAEIFIPNGATTSTPLDVMVFLSGGSKAYGDPATNGSSSDPIPSLVASRLSTFPMVLVRICVSSNNPPTTTVPWCLAVQALIARLVSDGMHVRRRGYYGWSTGGINGNIIVAALPGYFRWMMLIDPSITDNGLTGDGILGQPLPNSYVDPGPDNQDTAAINECMRRYAAYGTAMWLTHSNQAFTNPPPGGGQNRNIFSQVEPMAAIDALVAPADQFQKLTFAATTLPAITPTRPYVQARHTTGTSDHSEVDQTTAAAANWDAVTYPWIVDKNNSPNPVMGGGAYDYGSGRGRRRRSVGAMR